MLDAVIVDDAREIEDMEAVPVPHGLIRLIGLEGIVGYREILTAFTLFLPLECLIVPIGKMEVVPQETVLPILLDSRLYTRQFPIGGLKGRKGQDIFQAVGVPAYVVGTGIREDQQLFGKVIGRPAQRIPYLWMSVDIRRRIRTGTLIRNFYFLERLNLDFIIIINFRLFIIFNYFFDNFIRYFNIFFILFIWNIFFDAFFL